MRIIHVVPHINEEASGPSYSVPRLCQSLAECGSVVELKCLAASGPIPGVQLSVHRQWPLTGKFAVSTDLLRALRRESSGIDVVHNHSLWSMVNVAMGLVVRRHRTKLVVSPRGTLAPWALRRKRHVKALLKPLQWSALTRADLLHATSDVELEQIRALGLRVPVAVIGNGIDTPPPLVRPASTGPKALLYLSRIHPVKGIDNLLHAWRRLQSAYPDWYLQVVGTGEPMHIAHVKQLATSLNVRRVDFLGPSYGSDKAMRYANANLFILPSHTENFGMVVAEALAHGCPAIVSRGAPWSGLTREDCGWWVDCSIDALTHALDVAMGQPVDRLSDMGTKGRAWMQRDFSWGAVGAQMHLAYRWLSGSADRPAFVHTA